jgi:hypothetical protein
MSLSMSAQSGPDASRRRPVRSRVPFVSSVAPPVPLEPQTSPEQGCSWWEWLTFGWVYSVLRVGYARPLESSDLWRLSAERSANVYAQRILESFERRKHVADPPRLKSIFWRLRGQKYFERRRKSWLDKYEASLLMAMNDAVFSWFWIGGVLRLIADVGQMLSPLLVKALINFATESYGSEAPPPIGKGVGLAFGLLGLLWVVLLANTHAFYRMYTTGVILRAALIAVLFRQGVSLSNRGMAMIGAYLSIVRLELSTHDCCRLLFSAYDATVLRYLAHRLLLWLFPPSVDRPRSDRCLSHHPLHQFGLGRSSRLCIVFARWSCSRLRHRKAIPSSVGFS